MATIIASVRGMRDLLPEDTAHWQRTEESARRCFALYGYGEIRTPVIEQTELFKRQLGEHTELVEKEMYTFAMGAKEKSLTLRPEATVATMRALLQKGALGAGRKHRLYYMGPMFRHERPQQGRHRQFHQIGAEAIGIASPGADVETVAMCRRLWEMLGISPRLTLKVNNLGTAAERKAHRADLERYFRACEGSLDEDSRRRIGTNPLRILDSKMEATQLAAKDAPLLDGYLGKDSLLFFGRFLAGLQALGIECERDHRLVRGLDYYTNVVYEWVYAAEGKNLTLCGGGRYDGLAEQIGARPTPGCGFAIGTERLVELVRSIKGGGTNASAQCSVFVVYAAASAPEAAVFAEELREEGLSVCLDPDGGSFKSQMRRSDASGAAFALILGKDELESGEVSVKPLRQDSEQFRIPRTQVGNKLKELLDTSNVA